MGVLCTKSTYITLFNKPTTMTMEDFLNSEGYKALSTLMLEVTDNCRIVVDNECNHVELQKTQLNTNGIINETIYKCEKRLRKEALISWTALKEEAKKAIFELPNFDPEIFKEITFIDTTDEYKEYLSKKN